MSYLILATKDDAQARSRLAWETILGRKKNPADVTEFLWSMIIGKDGEAALVIVEQVDKLTVQETSLLVASLIGPNWTSTGPAL